MADILQPAINTPNNKAPAPKKDSQKLQSSTVKDAISKSRTMTGSRPDEININPIQEAAEKTAVMAYGRFNPPTIGHEKLVHKVESVADEHGGTAHIIASHSEGTGKNPLPTEKKVGYLKKIAREGTHVSSSNKEHPSFLQQAKKLHDAGNKHLVMVAGSDRAEDYHKKLHQYNGTHEGALYNFKSIKVVSAGQRDPDAEGATGMSGTKAREHARAGNMKEFKKALPEALHPHAEEIAKHIQSVKEDLDIDSLFEEMMLDEDFLDEKLSVQSRMRKALSMRRWGAKLELARKRSMMRRATSRVVMKRAKRLAIQKMKTKFAGGRDPNTLSTQEKQRIEDIMSKRRSAVKRLAIRLMPQVRKKEAARFQVREDFDAYTIDLMEEIYNIALEESNSAASGGVRGMGYVTGDTTSDAITNYAADNIASADSQKDNLNKMKKKIHDDLHEEIEQIDEISAELVGKVNKARLDKPSKSTAASKVLSNAVKKAWLGSKVGVKKEELDKNDPRNREDGTDSLVKIYKNDTPGEKKVDKSFSEAFKAIDREAVMRSNQDRKKEDLVARSGQDRKKSTVPYRQQEIQKKIVDEEVEQIDELSAKVLNNFVSKSIKKDPSSVLNKHPTGKTAQRKKAINLAFDKLKPGSAIKKPKVVATEQVEEGYETPVTKKNFGKTDHYQALDDLDLNTTNRNHTIDEYGYGPLNPNDTAGSNKFWQDKADLWNTSVEAAGAARCGNCAAFNQTKKIVEKINAGLGPEGEKISKLADLGFCEIFEFKCAAARTCDAWLKGGPIVDSTDNMEEGWKSKVAGAAMVGLGALAGHSDKAHAQDTKPTTQVTQQHHDSGEAKPGESVKSAMKRMNAHKTPEAKADFLHKYMKSALHKGGFTDGRFQKHVDSMKKEETNNEDI